jgi:Asp-tRNA(Asn)/Glu-tRNA(Gln) amidotransferase A subunit family amidase
VHERLASIGHEFIVKNINSFHPTTKSIYQSALSSNIKAWEVFQDQALQTQYTAQAQKILNSLEGGVDALVVPSAPCHPTIKEMLNDPVGLNSKLGIFSHAANVVDLCGVSINAGWVKSEGVKLPFGVTFLGGSGYDGKILDIAAFFENSVKETGDC